MNPNFEAIPQNSGCQSTRSFGEFSQQDIEGSIPTRFEKIVRLFPDHLAIKDGDRSLTYVSVLPG